MHSEGYLLISNVVYTNQIGFCFQQLSVEENQFPDAMTAIVHTEDPLQTYQCMPWQCTAAEAGQALPVINIWAVSKSRFHGQGTHLNNSSINRIESMLRPDKQIPFNPYSVLGQPFQALDQLIIKINPP